MMRHARETERPDDYQVDLSADIFRGLVFANFGHGRGSLKYTDDSGKGNHGTLTGFTGVGNTPVDRWGRAMGRSYLYFDGTHDYIPTTAFPFVVGPYTFSAWINTSSLSARRSVADLNGIASSLEVGTINGVANCAAHDTAAYWCTTPSNAISVNQWTHIVWQRLDNVQTVTVPHHLAIYVNGVSVGTPSSAATLNSDAGNTAARYIGCRSNLGQLWLGGIADPCLHARALSPSEIACLADPAWSVMLGGAIYTRPNRSFVGQVGGGAPTSMSSYYYQLLAGAA
jgi:hypothetical protein